MIRSPDESSPLPLSFAAPPRRALPWEDPAPLERLAFAALATTGPDPRCDGLRRFRAFRRADGKRELLERASDGDGRLLAADLLELADFLAERTVLVADRAAFLAWLGALLPGPPPALRVVELPALAALLSVRSRQTGAAPEPGETEPRSAETPEDLEREAARLVGRSLERSSEALALFAHGVESLVRDLARAGSEAASELTLAAVLCEHPSRWIAGVDPGADGALTRAFDAHATLEDALEAAEPAWARGERARSPSELAVRVEEPRVLEAADRRAVDLIFEEHLPRLLAGARGPSYRPGQHQLAARIAERFGAKELLLLHAPTGTGKTLAYLVPTLLWAQRNAVRVGVATFTRALQEQAMERDVPLALAALEQVGVRGLRVSVLKGRANYLCWRALLQALPASDARAEDLLAWLLLALFALEDLAGDLDRFPGRPPLAGLDRGIWREALQRALRLARAEPGCCLREADRRTCAAEAARERAERSHLVLTNHAFALARPEFFKHLVFDETEHLHAVAHDAFSHALPLRSLRELLARFHRRGAGGAERALGRIAGLAVPGGALWGEASAAIDAHEAAQRALGELARELETFERWRAARRSRARESEEPVEGAPEEEGAAEHLLFRAFVASEEGAALGAAQAELLAALEGLALGSARLVEELDALPARAAPRLRRALDVLRRELEEALAALRAWIPRTEDGRAQFGPAVFHDVERTSSGELVLVARVLLPHEFLGRRTYPDLGGAVFLSATTWLRGGFETAALYLGLARAAAPAEDEERAPCALHAFRAPEAFDYSRVIVLVPKDAPPVKDKLAFLPWVAGFVGALAERTRGRLLALFTNAEDLAQTAREVAPFLAERSIPFLWQGMSESTKEELGELFRSRVGSVLFGLDTFWFGTDFPGRALEHLVIVRLPYGVPDRYHEAQCAALGTAEQRRAIYMPRALAKFRQGFGRLMRRETDRGSVFVLDRRILDPRHRAFLKELPLANGPAGAGDAPVERLATLVAGDGERCIQAALAHLERTVG